MGKQGRKLSREARYVCTFKAVEALAIGMVHVHQTSANKAVVVFNILQSIVYFWICLVHACNILEAITAELSIC